MTYLIHEIYSLLCLMDRESIKSESEMQKSAEKMHSIKYMLYNIEAHKKVIIHLYGSDLILNLNADDFEFEKKIASK